MHRVRGVRRGLGQSWDESAARVERKRWSYLGVSPEVAVCLVATTATQAGMVESHARDPELWVTAASRWSSRKPRARGLRRGLGQTRDQSAVEVERKLWSYLGVSPEVAVCLVPRQHRQVGWSLKRKIPWFGWQQPRGEPRRMQRARGVRRGLGQFWDESAVRVERKRWSYLGVCPEVAVCLVPRQHRQISSLAEALPWPSVNLSWPRE